MARYLTIRATSLQRNAPSFAVPTQQNSNPSPTPPETAERLPQGDAAPDVEWQAMVDTVPAVLLYVDSERRILRANRLARNMLGTGRQFNELGPGEPWDAAKRLYDLVLATGVDDFMEVADPTSEKVWEITVSRVTSAEPVGSMVVAIRDIAERIQLERKLRRLDRLSTLGKLVHGISHTVRSNLFGVTGLIDVLDAAVGGDPEIRSYLEMQRQQTRRIVELLDRVMQYAGPTQPHLTPGPLAPILEAALIEARRQASTPEVEVIIEVDSDLPSFTTDRDRLTIAFAHLLQNALEHSPPGGLISVRASVESGDSCAQIHVAVEDQGEGIPPKYRPQIFEPFFSKRSEGHGLGLAIAQRILEDTGGNLGVLDHPQGGCRIQVVLPLGRSAAISVSEGAPQ